MQVPAARIETFKSRPAHEAREIAEAPADLTRRRPEKNDVVCCFQRRTRGEGAFYLSRPPFILERPERKVQFLQRTRHGRKRRLHPVQIGFRVKGISWFDRMNAGRTALEAGGADIRAGQKFVGDPQQIPFDLEADAALHSSFYQAIKLFSQQMAR